MKNSVALIAAHNICTEALRANMTFTVELLSRSTIKPSSPTPHHLKTLNLSLLDQYAPPFQFPILLFYSANNNNKLTPDRPKVSLSKILTRFYPFAGRIDGNHFIDCNDEGVNFFETRVNTRLSEVVSGAVPEQLDQLLPKDNFFGLGPKVLLSIQFNMFECGGMGIGVCLSHKAGDASSLAMFLNSWATLSRAGDDSEVLPPKFDLTSFFRPKEAVTPFIPLFGTQKVASKRFVFDAKNIAALKAKCSSKLYVEEPTRVEAVSALIWRCAMNVARLKPGAVKSSSVAQLAVNLRGRFVPPLSDLYIGNLFIGTDAISGTESLPELHVLVGLLHNSKAKVDGAYVRQLQDDGGLASHFESTKDATVKSAKGEIDLLAISSWCRFPFYECDFGWGTPVWISTVNCVCPNIITLMDTKCGEGIEAWIALYEDEMVGFEGDPELNAFISAGTAVIASVV